MNVIIIGDESKMRENFTKIMFDITLQKIKKDGGVKHEFNNKKATD